MSDTLQIDGRTWHLPDDDMSEAQENWMTERATAAGLLSYDVTQETVHRFFDRIMRENQNKPQLLFELFAAYYFPAGEDYALWTPAVAEHNALYFRSVVDRGREADLMQIKAGFRRIALKSAEISLGIMAVQVTAPN